MATALSTLRTRLRYALQDTETDADGNYTYADAVLNAWINAAIDRINRLVPFIPGAGNLTGLDGSLYYFDLATIFSSFLRLRSLTPQTAGAAPLGKDPRGLAYVDYLTANSLIAAGTPTCYFNDGGTVVYFDMIPAASDTIYCRYWAQATALSLDAHTPQGLLATGFDSLIINMAKVEIGDDLSNELGKSLGAEGHLKVFGAPGKKGLIDEFSKWVNADLGHFDEVNVIYSDYRGGIGHGSNIASQPDFTEPL